MGFSKAHSFVIIAVAVGSSFISKLACFVKLLRNGWGILRDRLADFGAFILILATDSMTVTRFLFSNEF